MSNQSTDDFDDDDEGETEPEPNLVKQLRNQLKDANKRAKEVDDARAENSKLKREFAIRDAGLSLNERQREAFEKSYSGDLSSEAVRSYAVDLGWAQPTQAEQEVDSALEGQERIARASQGSTTATGADEYLEKIKAAQSPDEVMAIAAAAGRFTAWDVAQ